MLNLPSEWAWNEWISSIRANGLSAIVRVTSVPSREGLLRAKGTFRCKTELSISAIQYSTHALPDLFAQ
ncbi:hypothetical protein HanHA300_Chr12g0439601 [Helianthus annuus]|nr:hypothetical protein HanHA300_Chr12g0439601 [Helianthus annuus]KAJ0504928.1 hypothetical protein HanHA89_Chr12g0464721 [Helianthus annuus]KAJ0674618.1 hypothetical protein HanLR1_Chr12g0441911 [Helianthus annuus]